MTPQEALTLLQEGNHRFVSERFKHPDRSASYRAQLTAGQRPFAVVLGCSDSRVPPEVIFDQGLGALFVVRLAGNLVDDLALGSIEYAVDHLEVPLVLVLGHTRCGAVTAAVRGGHAPGKIPSLIEALQPALAAVSALPGDPVENAALANLKLMAARLLGSEVLGPVVRAGKLRIATGRYDLHSGKVELTG